MTETLLMNDEAARSPTGEILDQSTQAPSTQTPSEPTSTTQTTPAADATAPTTPTATDPAKTDAAPSPAPEAYADFTVPDGYTLDPAALKEATPVFRELGLTQDQAQKLVNIQVAREMAIAKAAQDAYTPLRQQWQATAKADPELSAAASGGKTGLDAVKLDIGRALNVLPPDLRNEFRDAMNLTGAGDNPAFIKAFWKLSAYVTEGTHVTGRGPSTAGQVAPGQNVRPSAAKALYPNNP